MTGREIALRVMRKALRTGPFIQEMLEREFRLRPVPQEEKRLATELACGCMRMMAELDWIIEQRAGRKIASISPGLREILRIGIYQLRHLDRIPEYAAVHETVELAKRHGPRGSEKFVNAVLRSYILKGVAFPPREESVARHLSVVRSHPLWLVDRWIAAWGEEETEKILAADNVPPPLTVRVNALKTSRDELLSLLAGEGVEACLSSGHRLAVDIEKLPLPLAELGAFRKGMFQVQDVAGMRVVDLIGAGRGERIADLCAAPGGKATGIAEAIGDEGEVICLDISAGKIKMIEENAGRLGLKSLKAHQGDALRPQKVLAGREFDRVLVDAPCSNTGVLRRRSEARWRIKLADIERLARTQLKILSRAAGLVRKGGVVVYSSCSLEPEENEGVVRRFLESFRDFSLSAEMRFFPHRDGCDGGYAAKLEKRGQATFSEMGLKFRGQRAMRSDSMGVNGKI